MITERKITKELPKTNFCSSDVAQLFQAVGTSSFISTALTFAGQAGGARFISVFCQGDRDRPLLVGTACSLGQRRADDAAHGYDRHVGGDRNSALLNGDRGNGDFLTSQEVSDITSFTYRRDCYERPGISGRISLIRRTPSYGLSVSIYSSAEDGPFPLAIYDRAAAGLGVLLAATERHVAFSLKNDVWQGQDIQARLALSYPTLTPREREVAAMAIKGRTAAEIGRILGLAETTIITHRKNAYKRMK